jgi:hypothetical protein
MKDYPPLTEEVAETLYNRHDRGEEVDLDEITRLIFHESCRLRLVEKCPHGNWRMTKRAKLILSMLKAMDMMGCMNFRMLED